MRDEGGREKGREEGEKGTLALPPPLSSPEVHSRLPPCLPSLRRTRGGGRKNLYIKMGKEKKKGKWMDAIFFRGGRERKGWKLKGRKIFFLPFAGLFYNVSLAPFFVSSAVGAFLTFGLAFRVPWRFFLRIL